MREHLDPALIATGVQGGVPATEGGHYPPPGSTAYVTQVLKSQDLNLRNEREIRTLAASLDLISRGKIFAAGDFLMQRLKAVEMAAQDGHWRAATHMELLPNATASASTTVEREAAVNLEQATSRYQGQRGGGANRQGRDGAY